ncbi:MAG: hypothetical protein FJ397_04130 [Verrucomicrobia bacterium]|nr:hypothetical protein [Verrucomicrobiota bacterium]
MPTPESPSPQPGKNPPPPTNALQALWQEQLRTGFMDLEKPAPQEAGAVTVTFHRPPPPEPTPHPPEDPAVAALTGPYWDRLRQLKRVRITCPPSSGIVVSRSPADDPPPPAQTSR